MNIDDLRKITKDKPASFMRKNWAYYPCDMKFLENEDAFNELEGKGKLMLAYVNLASRLGVIVKRFFPMSDYSFDAIRDYELSNQVLRADDDIDALSLGEAMCFIQRRLREGASLVCVPILMREVDDDA